MKTWEGRATFRISDKILGPYCGCWYVWHQIAVAGIGNEFFAPTELVEEVVSHTFQETSHMSAWVAAEKSDPECLGTVLAWAKPSQGLPLPGLVQKWDCYPNPMKMSGKIQPSSTLFCASKSGMALFLARVCEGGCQIFSLHTEADAKLFHSFIHFLQTVKLLLVPNYIIFLINQCSFPCWLLIFHSSCSFGPVLVLLSYFSQTESQQLSRPSSPLYRLVTPTSLKCHEFRIPDVQPSNPFGFVYWNLSGWVLAKLDFQWFNDQRNHKSLWRNLTSAG